MYLTVDMFTDMMGRGFTGLCGVVLGGVAAWLLSRWKRHRQRQSILLGDARDTVVIEHHLVEATVAADGTKVPKVLRMRSLGQEQIDRVAPNGYLSTELLHRACRVTAHETLISMDGIEGSYLLETLTNFVCDRVANGAFEHDHYVMAPCCEPAGLAVHQPITIILIAVSDLPLFESWQACRNVQVEHGSDGARVLTLMELALRFRSEREQIAALREKGQRTTYVETSYILDLGLDKRSAAIPVKAVPWERFGKVLKQMKLQ